MHRNAAIILAAVLVSCSNGAASKKTAPLPLKKVAAPDEVAAPEPGPPVAAQGPLEYSLDLEIDHEHGCSQSHQSTGVDATLKLEIDSEDEAVLTLHLKSTSVMGPSFSKFQQGDDSFYSTHKQEHSVWTGTAKRSGSRLSVTFEWIETASYEVQGYGGELPPAKKSPSSLTLLCAKSTKPVYAALEKDEYFWDVEGKTPESAEVMLCKPSDEILGWHHDMALVDGGIPLAEPPGISMLSSKMFYNEQQIIRHKH
ncbi:MAG: hypothetical protein JRG91_13400 [Deltaproteobacteria bacterium]|nr:hypothetical protein [Deltaproteobacteria bacterium]